MFMPGAQAQKRRQELETVFIAVLWEAGEQVWESLCW